MFMWNTRTPARTHTSITWFQNIWQLSLWIWSVFSVKNTNKPKHHHAPNNDVFVLGPEARNVRLSGCHETDERNSEMEERLSHMEGVRVATIITQHCYICFNDSPVWLHHTTKFTATVTSLKCFCMTQSKLLIISAVAVCSFAVLTDRLVRIAAEVLGTHGDVWTTAGWWRGLAELQRVDDIIIFIYGLPCVAAAQAKSIEWLNPIRLAVIWNV